MIIALNNEGYVFLLGVLPSQYFLFTNEINVSDG